MKLARICIVPLLCIPLLSLAAPGPERTVATLELAGKTPSTAVVVRQRLGDGGLKLRLVITPKGDPKKQRSVTLYEGGADDDGPTDKSFRAASGAVFPLPGGRRGVRVDFEFQVPGSRKFRQIDTYLVAIDEPAKLSLEVTTRRERKRSKVCQDVEVTELVLDKDRLVARPISTLESELNDDDLPIDKSCHGKQTGPQVTYKFDGDVFVQVDPPPAPKKPKPSEDESD